MGLMLISPLNLPLQRYSFLRRRLEDLDWPFNHNCPSDILDTWINDRPPELVVCSFSRSEAQHHECEACRAHQIVAFLDHAAVFAVIKPKFFRLRTFLTAE